MAKKSNKKGMKHLPTLLENCSGTVEDFSEINECLLRFCQDNILALKTMMDEVEDTTAIEERILHFALIYKILNGISSFSEDDVEENFEEEKKTDERPSKKKKASKKKNKE